MAVPSISQTEFFAIINGNVHQKFSQCADRQVVSNRAVRFVLGDMDLRSHKRSSQLSPNMFENVFDYAAPSDLKGEKIIDFRKQVRRSSYEKWLLVDEVEFDRRKNISTHRVAIKDENFGKILRIDGVEGFESKTLHDCNSVTANGTWAVGTDASNITADADNFISGSALNFDMATGAATGYIENTGMTE